jgi:hypothetical protein
VRCPRLPGPRRSHRVGTHVLQSRHSCSGRTHGTPKQACFLTTTSHEMRVRQSSANGATSFVAPPPKVGPPNPAAHPRPSLPTGSYSQSVRCTRAATTGAALTVCPAHNTYKIFYFGAATGSSQKSLPLPLRVGRPAARTHASGSPARNGPPPLPQEITAKASLTNCKRAPFRSPPLFTCPRAFHFC